MDPLGLFYRDEVMRESLKAFMIETLRELAADAALNGEPTTGFQEASWCVDNTFDRLEELYAVKKGPTVTNSL